VFGTLPEFTAIITLERHHVLLRLVDENAETFLQHLVGAHGDGHLDLADIPFLPCSLVEPEPAVLQPFIAGFLDAAHGLEYDVETDLMGAMRVGDVASTVDMLRLQLPEQGDG